MLDLFDTPLIAGLACAGGFLDGAEEQALIAAIDAQRLTPFQFGPWTGKRLTCSFGWHYDFVSGALDRAEAMPPWLLPIRARAAAFDRLPPEALTQALVIRYDPGAGIGWHRDRPVYAQIVGISLGAAATMRFRRRQNEVWQRCALSLPPRGIYHLAGEARAQWQHSITPIASPRWSLTFRSFADAARHAAL